MASLGEMSAGIAHEINNPLAIIVFKVQKIHKNVVEKTLDETKVLQDLKDIKDTALRISTIVKGLKAFSRNSENDPFERVKVRSVIEDSLVLCKERFKNGNVNLIVGEIPDLSFNGRASQISQILINILNNAYDAVRESENPWIKIDVKETDKAVIHFVITDSGPGIDPDTAEKMMDPFFTTKPLGLGTGLGLSISLAMAKDHGGSVFLDQSSDNTSFVVEIPALTSEESDSDHGQTRQP
jgi:C4-dicarboxylate-specific signal transduction histidine kinase